MIYFVVIVCYSIKLFLCQRIGDFEALSERIIFDQHNNSVDSLVDSHRSNFNILENSELETFPFLMDISWVLQGFDFSFQGFFVEYLGFSSAIRMILSESILVQSSTRFNSSEYHNKLPFHMKPELENQLFEKEKKNLRYLVDKTQHSRHHTLGKRNFTAKFLGRDYLPVIDSVVAVCGVESFDNDYYSSGGAMGRFHVDNIANSVDCCKACFNQPLCVAWSFKPNDYYENVYNCELKGSMPTLNLPMAGSSSGKMKYGSNGRIPLPKAYIFHGTTCVYNNNTVIHTKRDINTIYIGRYMLERASFTGGFTVDEFHVAHCVGLMDEIWIPTEWHRNVFHKFMNNLGIRSPPLYVIPEAVDTELFDPKLSNPHKRRYSKYEYNSSNMIFMSANVKDISAISMHGNHHLGSCWIGEMNEHVFCDHPARLFEFISIFKWEYRKGWDILLESYWSAFTHSDQVVLRIKSYLPSTERGSNNISIMIAEFASSKMNKSLSELARVVWEETEDSIHKKSESLSRADMRDLLASADAFVLPTRGEGWGLPVAEAMSMELPVIITNYSGPTAFVRENNSYLLSVEDNLDNTAFAIPNKQHLSLLMRQVIIDSFTFVNVDKGLFDENGNGTRMLSVAKLKGKNARLTMKEFNPISIVTQMANRLRHHAALRGWEFP
eukprot:gene8887-11986_t